MNNSQAPTTLRGRLRFLGPGIVFAALAVGSGELILIPRSGALYGYALVWVIIITVVYKAALTDGIARCTVATGDDVFASLALLPGPKHWANYLIMTVFVAEMAGYGGIALAAGSAVHALVPNITMQFAALVLVLAIPVLLFSGSYRHLEKVILAMSVVLAAGAVYCVGSVPVQLDDLAMGLVPSIPAGSTSTIMGLMGWVGAGTTTLLYSVWVKEKIGKSRDESDYRRWMSTVRIDIACAYGLVGLLAFCFLILGVATLRQQKLVPEREEMMTVLAQMLARIPYGQPVFLMTGLFTLFGTIVAGVDGKSRALASWLASLSPRFGSRLKVYRGALGLYVALMLLAILLGRPVLLIRITSAVVSVVFGLIGFMLLCVDTQLPQYARGSRTWRVIVVLGSTTFLFVAIGVLFV